MTIRYRGFRILGTDPTARPALLRVYDPMRPTEELDEFSDPSSFDRTFGHARAYLDGRRATEVDEVAAGGGLEIP